MNQQTKLRNCFTLATMLAVALLLSGCLLLPYTNPTSAEVRGKVLNTYTGRPIEGAKVALAINPKHATETDTLGDFRLTATHKWHLFVTIQLAACPPTEDRFDSSVFIRHPEYIAGEMHVTTNSEYFLVPTNKAEYIKQKLKPVYLPTNSIPARYLTNYFRTNSSFRVSGTNRFNMTNQPSSTNSFR